MFVDVRHRVDLLLELARQKRLVVLANRLLHRVVHPQQQQHVHDRILLRVAPRVAAIGEVSRRRVGVAELAVDRLVNQVADLGGAVVEVVMVAVVLVLGLRVPGQAIGQVAALGGREVELADVDRAVLANVVVVRVLDVGGGDPELELALQVLRQHVRAEAEHAEVVQVADVARAVLDQQRVVTEVLMDLAAAAERDERDLRGRRRCASATTATASPRARASSRATPRPRRERRARPNSCTGCNTSRAGVIRPRRTHAPRPELR